MESAHAAHRHRLPRRHLRRLHAAQPRPLVARFDRRRARRHLRRAPRHVVLRLAAARLRRRLPRLQAAAARPADAHKRDPAADPSAGVVLGPRRHDGGWWRSALWRRLHRALLHHVLHLAAALLLRVWLPGARAAHPHHHLRRDLDRDVLLPALRGGLPLVVARLPHLGLVGGVHVCVLGLLLLHQARDHKAHLVLALLRLHVHRRPRVLRPHGHHWLLRVLLVRVEDLLGHQGRLGRRGEGEERECGREREREWERERETGRPSVVRLVASSAEPAHGLAPPQ
mmetsp:Transcript_44027/g.141985  ORF Transcript_44027/g.141985 Transcript_44027/m.141985 type:complete len:284 (+) Transcript_44027:1242-2093(+)